jgi:HEPN domain-containing protein
LAAAELRQLEGEFHNVICFHCQQAAEKILKAMMQELSLPFPRTHDLSKLVGPLVPHVLELRSLKRKLIWLTRFAVDCRYPGDKATSRQSNAAWKYLRALDAVRIEWFKSRRRKPHP